MINRNALRTLLFLVVVLLIMLHYAGPAIGISTALQLEKQGSPAVWFKSFLFLACAVILSLIALQARHTGQGNGWRWGVFAGVMLYLSINSATGINKKLVLNFIDWACDLRRRRDPL